MRPLVIIAALILIAGIGVYRTTIPGAVNATCRGAVKMLHQARAGVSPMIRCQ